MDQSQNNTARLPKFIQRDIDLTATASTTGDMDMSGVEVAFYREFAFCQLLTFSRVTLETKCSEQR
jgi:hypothetical protein